ncbi:MAG: sulfotransferase family protein [Terriglobales bacterium]
MDRERLGIVHLVFSPGSRPRRRPRTWPLAHGAIASIPLCHGHAENRALLLPRPPSANEAQRLASRASAAIVRCYAAPTPGLIREPVFIVSAPRAGSTLLFELLARSPELWTVGGESHEIFERRWQPPGLRGNALGAADATAAAARIVHAGFASVLRDHCGRLLLAMSDGPRFPVRLLEKTPKNALRIPFLKAIFPGAKFVYLYREPRANIASLIEGWRALGRFVQYRPDGRPWCFLLPPNWPDLVGQSAHVVAGAQWRTANEAIMGDLSALDPSDSHCLDYEELVAHPGPALAAIGRFASVDLSGAIAAMTAAPPPLSSSVLAPPRPDKWTQHERSLDEIWPAVRGTIEQYADYCAARRRRE